MTHLVILEGDPGPGTSTLPGAAGDAAICLAMHVGCQPKRSHRRDQGPDPAGDGHDLADLPRFLTSASSESEGEKLRKSMRLPFQELLDDGGDSRRIETVVGVEGERGTDRNVFVRNTVAFEPAADPSVGQCLGNGAAETAGDVVFLDGQDAAGLASGGEDGVFVERGD